MCIFSLLIIYVCINTHKHIKFAQDISHKYLSKYIIKDEYTILYTFLKYFLYILEILRANVILLWLCQIEALNFSAFSISTKTNPSEIHFRTISDIFQKEVLQNFILKIALAAIQFNRGDIPPFE